MMRLIAIVFFVCSYALAVAQPAPPGATTMIISEIFYDMPGSSDSLEFIELTNPSDSSQRSLSLHQFSEGVAFTFPFGLLIPPSGVVVVAKDSVAFSNAFGRTAYQWESGDLDDNGELVMLRNNFNLPIDSVNYQTNSQWPDASGNGKSIVLCDISQPNTGPSNWEAAETNTGIVVDGISIFANPGTTCDNWVNIESVNELEFSIYPNPNQGSFTLSLPTDKKNVELELINTLGKTVWRNDVNKDASLTFDLRNEVSAGLYFLTLHTKNATSSQPIIIME